MVDTSGLRHIGFAFAVVTFLAVTAAAAVVANVDADQLVEIESRALESR